MVLSVLTLAAPAAQLLSSLENGNSLNHSCVGPSITKLVWAVWSTYMMCRAYNACHKTCFCKIWTWYSKHGPEQCCCGCEAEHDDNLCIRNLINLSFENGIDALAIQRSCKCFLKSSHKWVPNMCSRTANLRKDAGESW